MILKSEDTNSRLASTQNLLNRLNINRNPRSDVESHNPVTELVNTDDEISIDDLINDVDSKINIAKIHSKSVDVLNKTLDELKYRVIEEDSAAKLAHIARDVSTVVKTIREDQRQRNQLNQNSGQPIVIYKPVIMSENDFSFISSKD